MILEAISVGPMDVNCYVLASGTGSKAVIIDPGDQFRKIKQFLDRNSLTPGIVINTHGHYDHIGCDDKFGVIIYVHKDDAGMLKDPQLNLSAFFASSYRVESEIITLSDGQIIEFEGVKLKVLHIPGHTPGGIALVLLEPENNVVFTGDSLFAGGVGRSDLTGGNHGLLVSSIKEKIMVLADTTIVYPGHGPASTIKREKQDNSFLK